MQLKSKAKLVFVTTSYVPEEEGGRFKKDPIRYNAAAKKVMEKYGVVVHDVYNKSTPIHHKFGKGVDDVHYSEEGYRKLANLITDFLRKEMR